MNFHYLIDAFPSQVEAEGTVYDVRSDFRSILSILSLMEDETFTETEKRVNALSMFYIDRIPASTEAALTAMYEFMGCYQEEKETQKSREKAFDFSVDSMDIYSAFYQIYGIDLEQCELHWFKFIALFGNINDGTPNIVNKTHIRTADLEGMSDEQKIRTMILKKEYSLEKQESFSDHQNRLANAFWIGGDD